MPPDRDRLATVHRIRPRRSQQTEALQGVLDLGGWPEQFRQLLNERLTSILPDTLPAPWGFVMVTSQADLMAAFLAAIDAGPRANFTLRVWNGLMPFIRRDTGEIVCGQRKLAATAHVALGDVPRALTRLVEMGVLLKEGRGHYRLNPHFAWNGSLAKRESTAASAPRPKLVPVE